MNLNFQHIKDSFFILLFVGLIVLFSYFNGCNREWTTPNDDYAYEKEMYEITIDDANFIIDSLLQEIKDGRSKKQVIEERIKIKNIYLTAKRDTVRKLIKDSSVLAYVDTLESKVEDQDSVIKTQVKEILDLDNVIYKKDIVILNKDIIQAKTEEELNASLVDSKKKDKRIKLLKIERVLYPAIVAAGVIYLVVKP